MASRTPASVHRLIVPSPNRLETAVLQMIGGPSVKRDLSETTKWTTGTTTDMEDKIRQRAYELYERRGRGDGSELEDWVQAEAEVLGSREAAKAA
jgi:hypothetical protein